jgi:hypothetical protein
MQIQGKRCISIFRTIRLSIALSSKSGTYVELTATFCSAMPWSRSVPPMMAVFVLRVEGLTKKYYNKQQHNATTP